ncbi:MAG: right-handed parallel beta-helix repeat-containing protein, partial [Thermoplasmatales archaeon]|nr:right-handed parallel beta-helix repeat-containing protein [Thermoplasmatales archaeon]
MTENINVKGGVFNNTFIENEDGIFVIGGTLTLTKNYIEGVWGWSYNLLCIETDLEFIDTHMNTGFIGIIYIDMRLKMIDSSISDIEIGLLSLAGLYLKWYPEDMDWVENSSITLLNSTINNTGVAMIIGPKSLSITDSTISNSGGWWYEGYGFDGMDVWECSVSISDTIISNVNFCSFTNCPTVTVADHSQFTGCAGSLQVTNSVLTVTDSSFDWNDKGISSSQSEIHVRDNIFSNQSYAIYSTESSGEVLNNWVTESRNAGITVVDSSLTIGATNAGNHFRGDTTSIDCQHSSPSIIDNDFSGSGTGISCWDDSSPDIVSNEFHDIATIGIYSSGSSPSIVGNIFKNISREAIKCEDESVLTIINNTMRYT